MCPESRGWYCRCARRIGSTSELDSRCLQCMILLMPKPLHRVSARRHVTPVICCFLQVLPPSACKVSTLIPLALLPCGLHAHNAHRADRFALHTAAGNTHPVTAACPTPRWMVPA